MNDLVTPGTHPLGWPLLGAGALPWFIGLAELVGFDYRVALEAFDVSGQVLLILAIVTFSGLLAEATARIFEGPFIHLLETLRPSETSASYAAWCEAQLLR